MILNKLTENEYEILFKNFGTLNKKDIPVTWNFYYNQYQKVLCYLVNEKHPIDIRFMSLMFVFRHTVELFLKERIHETLNTHSITKLVSIYKDNNLPIDFLEQLQVLKCDGEGEEFKYSHNKSENRFFNNVEVLCILPSLEYFFKIANIDVAIENKPKGKFEVHAYLLRTMSQISTDYDESIYLILQGIKEDRLSVNEVFLPLIFLIRHSIELSLKQNLLDAGEKYLSPKQISKIKNEHSICKLFNLFESIINTALNNMSECNDDDLKFKQETKSYHKGLNDLKQIIHEMDYNSFFYRFPFDKDGQPHKLSIDSNKLIDILQLREKVNAYLTFAVYLLQEYGYLESDYEYE